MNLDSILFIDSYPSIDLHGYDRESARVAINDFIEENYKLHSDIVVIIHGIGSGIIRQATHQTLIQNKKVLDFKTYYNNQGCTVVQIRKIDK